MPLSPPIVHGAITIFFPLIINYGALYEQIYSSKFTHQSRDCGHGASTMTPDEVTVKEFLPVILLHFIEVDDQTLLRTSIGSFIRLKRLYQVTPINMIVYKQWSKLHFRVS